MNIESKLAVCSWSLKPTSPAELAQLLHQVNVPRTQLALGPVLNQPAWANALTELNDARIAIVSGMIGCIGEDYSSLESIRRTGGIVPDEHWSGNRANAERAADLAASAGIKIITFHAGFIPHDSDDSSWGKLTGRITELADMFAARGIDMLMETGQETADSLIQLIEAVGRENLGVNFDPANMILYGMGDPIAALSKLMPHVRQIHLKDGTASPVPGQWGKEVPVGQGEVDWAAFLQVVADAHYTGDLVIEREAGATRVADIAAAVEHVTRVGASIR